MFICVRILYYFVRRKQILPAPACDVSVTVIVDDDDVEIDDQLHIFHAKFHVVFRCSSIVDRELDKGKLLNS